MKYLKTFLVLLLFTLIASFSNANDYEFSGVSEKDSQFAMNHNRVMLNDDEGNIFMIYNYLKSGPNVPKAAKWDGTQLRIFSDKDNLPYGVVRNIVEDKIKGVWMASDEGLVYYYDEQFEHYPLPKATEGYRKIVRDKSRQQPLIQDKDGYIWALVQRYEQEDTYTEGFSENSFRMSSEYTELWMFKEGDWSKYEQINFHNTSSIILTKNNKGNLVIALRIYESGNWSKKRFNITHDDITVIENGIQDFKSGRVTYHIENAVALNDRLLFSYNPTEPAGCYTAYEAFSIVDPKTELWEHYGPPGFENDFDYKVIPFSIISNKGNVIDNRVQLLQPDGQGGIWMGNRLDRFGEDYDKNGGGLVWFYYVEGGDDHFERFSPAKQTFFDTIEFGPGRKFFTEGLDRISGVAYNKNGDLWIGTEANGLFSIPADELPEAPVTSNSIQDDDNLEKYILYQNKPNPFNKHTTISYQIPKDTKVHLEIIDLNGNTIRTLVSEYKTKGTYSISFYPEEMQNGVYFYRLHTDDSSETKRMIYIR